MFVFYCVIAADRLVALGGFCLLIAVGLMVCCLIVYLLGCLFDTMVFASGWIAVWGFVAVQVYVLITFVGLVGWCLPFGWRLLLGGCGCVLGCVLIVLYLFTSFVLYTLNCVFTFRGCSL